jgi:hypothetical protein
MKCPRCGERIPGATQDDGDGFAVGECGACVEELEALFPGHDIEDDDHVCHCEHPDDAGSPECLRCGGDLR